MDQGQRQPEHVASTIDKFLDQITRKNTIVSQQQSSTEKCCKCGVNPGTVRISRGNHYLDTIICEECAAKMRAREADQKMLALIPPKFIGIETDKIGLMESCRGKNLFITGRPGAGKTVFACSIAKSDIRAGTDILFINFPAFIMQLQSAFRKDNASPFEIAQRVATFHGLLIIDDLGVEKATDYVRQITYYVINDREIYCRRTVITTNFTLAQLAEQIDIRIASRIAGMCEVLIFNGEDRRLR